MIGYQGLKLQGLAVLAPFDGPPESSLGRSVVCRGKYNIRAA